MIRFDPAYTEALRTFRKVLDAYDYDVMLRTLRGLYYFHDPWLADKAYLFNHETIPLCAESRTLFELFTFGESVKEHEAVAVFGKELLEDLISLGLLERDEGKVSTDRYLIISQNGRYFIITYPDSKNPNHERDFSVYMGQDSYKLLHHLDQSRAGIRALDLCSGSGIIGQMVGLLADEVIGVEYSSEAVEVSQTNAVINGLENRWSVRQGDLWKPVEGERFDLILSNPPFVPIPLDFDFPIYGFGGKDGLLFIKDILDKAPEHLNPGGRIQMVFEGIGSAEEAVVEPLLKEVEAEHPDWSIKLLLYSRVYLWEEPMKLFGEAIAHIQEKSGLSVEVLSKKILDAFQKDGHNYMYKALLFVDTDPFAKKGLEVLRVYNPWDEKSVPKVKWPTSFQDNPNYILYSSKGVSLQMNSIERAIATAMDGTRNLAEAAEQAWMNSGGTFSGTPKAFYLEQAMKLSQILHQLDFIDPPAGFWDDIENTHNPYASQATRKGEGEIDSSMQTIEDMFFLLMSGNQQATPNQESAPAPTSENDPKDNKK